MTTMNNAAQSGKEAAYLFDLYVAQDWGERFTELLGGKLKLPQEGSLLYVLAGTGNHILKMAENTPDKLKLFAIEPDEEQATLAISKIEALRLPIMFREAEPTNLPFDDDSFEVVICEASLQAANALPALLTELRRVAAPSAPLYLTTVTSGSYGEVVSLIWETMYRADLLAYENYVEDLVLQSITTSNLSELATRAGWRSAETETRTEIFTYASDKEFFDAPLITHFLMPRWTAGVRDAKTVAGFIEELRKVYVENADDLDFQFTVKATILTGRK